MSRFKFCKIWFLQTVLQTLTISLQVLCYFLFYLKLQFLKVSENKQLQAFIKITKCLALRIWQKKPNHKKEEYIKDSYTRRQVKI